MVEPRRSVVDKNTVVEKVELKNDKREDNDENVRDKHGYWR